MTVAIKTKQVAIQQQQLESNITLQKCMETNYGSVQRLEEEWLSHDMYIKGWTKKENDKEENKYQQSSNHIRISLKQT